MYNDTYGTCTTSEEARFVTTTLNEAIRASGLTKTECARAAGVARSQLYMYETGKVRPELKNAVRIAEALGIEVEEVAEFGLALKEAETRRTQEIMERILEQISESGREVHITFGELPAWLRNELGRYAGENPGAVEHLTLNLTLDEMQALVSGTQSEPASKNGTGN
jgi:transcriptional regulator with XRE-family HTH domain